MYANPLHSVNTLVGDRNFHITIALRCSF